MKLTATQIIAYRCFSLFSGRGAFLGAVMIVGVAHFVERNIFSGKKFTANFPGQIFHSVVF
jgi:hypothetical protein